MAEPLAQNPEESSQPDPPKQGRGPGRRFEQGKSGNPGGRPKGLAKAVRERLDKAAEQNPELTGADLLVAFWMTVMANTEEDTALRLKASQYLAERGWGKPAAFAPIDEEDPLELADRDIDDVVASFDRRLDEVAERRSRHSLNGG